MVNGKHAILPLLRRLTMTGVLTMLLLSVGAVLAGRAQPGDLLTYSAYIDGYPDIFLIDPASGIRVNLTNTPDAYDSATVWSPDAEQFAFLSDRDGGLRVYVMDVFTGRVRRITERAAMYFGLRWRGDRIFMAAGLNADQRQFSAAPDGSDFRELTEAEIAANLRAITQDFDPTNPGGGSPDGRQRLLAQFDGTWGLYVTSTDEDAPRRVADLGRAYMEIPQWSPDSRRAAFISDADGQTDAYIVDLTTGAVQRLTHDRRLETNIVWRPVSAAASTP